MNLTDRIDYIKETYGEGTVASDFAEEVRILQEKLEEFGNKMITEFDCFDPVYFKGQDLLFYLNQELG